jgi:hypothetical protein
VTRVALYARYASDNQQEAASSFRTSAKHGSTIPSRKGLPRPTIELRWARMYGTLDTSR